ncbi:hypothetical protein ACFL27_04140 [candidate division CSSED10-310 bacterium]|uniref:SH3b domain-containing protein n=1 Tax=candidate division CSSED10-310 bacterium TaxID=2855610 RepID=A0ABV6YT53_UNCC1
MIRKIYICLVFNILILPAPGSQAAEKYTLKFVTAHKLTVRSRPTVRSRKVGILTKGTRIYARRTTVSDTFRGVTDYWYKCKKPAGYVFGSYLSDVSLEEFVSPYCVIEWLGKRPDTFGCYLEKEFGFSHSKFNCSLQRYQIETDPCNKKTFYEGPPFPSFKKSRIHPLVEQITLYWEAGKLRAIDIVCKKRLNKTYIRKLFNLPGEGSFSDRNIYKIKIQDQKQRTRMLLEAFAPTIINEEDCLKYQRKK